MFAPAEPKTSMMYDLAHMHIPAVVCMSHHTLFSCLALAHGTCSSPKSKLRGSAKCACVVGCPQASRASRARGLGAAELYQSKPKPKSRRKDACLTLYHISALVKQSVASVWSTPRGGKQTTFFTRL